MGKHPGDSGHRGLHDAGGEAGTRGLLDQDRTGGEGSGTGGELVGTEGLLAGEGEGAVEREGGGGEIVGGGGGSESAGDGSVDSPGLVGTHEYTSLHYISIEWMCIYLLGHLAPFLRGRKTTFGLFV